MHVALLSLAFAFTAAGDPCDLPPQYTLSVTSQPADIEFTLAVDKPVSHIGQTVTFYYRVKNLGSTTRMWNTGQCPENAFVVYPDDCTALGQAGCFDRYLYFYPEVVYFFPCAIRIAPGECKVFTQTWDLMMPDFEHHRMVPTPPGTYRLLGGIWNTDPTAAFWPGVFLDDSGVSLEIEIQAAPVAVHPSTWGAVKAIYIEP